MEDSGSFLLNQVSFGLGNLQPSTLVLVADAEPKSGTHITLLMGANGTSKSRIMSGIINLLRKLEMGLEKFVDHPSSKISFWQEHDLECLSMVSTSSGQLFEKKTGSLTVEPESLPSRILALANLVRDRFSFEDRQPESSTFYYYLGVRQASNMTTTGGLDRLVTDSILELVAAPDRFREFELWAQQLFPDCTLSLDFSLKSQKRFSDRFDTTETVEEILKKTVVAKRDRWKEQIPELARDIIKLFKFLDKETIETSTPFRPRRISLVLSDLSEKKLAVLGGLSTALDAACSVRLLERPSLGLKRNHWLSFMQLSSGEQNLLSTGARLLAFARPRSLILIDEPEVSLNVAWQQRYIELILQALEHAPGSHVIIASHSPYLVSDLKRHESTVVVIEKKGDDLRFQSHAGEFWGWGAEAVLYEVLGIPSASNYHFSRELATVLKLVQERSLDTRPIDRFLQKCDQLEFEGEAEPLSLVIEEIRAYFAGVKP
jgi:ABC-type Mn2+/Zn2+ transport system ATPase subunit